MNIKTINNVNFNGKKVLLRLDLNVPIKDGEIADTTRIKESIPTIKKIISDGGSVIILSHLGRPNGVYDKKFSLEIVSKKLGELIGKEINFSSQVIGEESEKKANNLKNGEILMLENVRFEKGKEKGDEILAEKFAKMGDIFVFDGFGASHRAHSSVSGIAKFLPTFGGFLMEKEIKNLSQVFQTKKENLIVLISGSKIDTKIEIIEKFLEKADKVIIGGAIANTLLKAKGYEVGDSLVENDKLEIAKKILEKGKNILLPIDGIASEGMLNTSLFRQIDIPEEATLPNEKILDIGSKTMDFYGEEIKKYEMIVMNGPVGVYEIPSFSLGTKKILEKIRDSKAKSIIGGGDTIDALHFLGLKDEDFTHISTGGGASLEFLAGKKLPGVEMLLEK